MKMAVVHRAAGETGHGTKLSPDQRTCCLCHAAGAFRIPTSNRHHRQSDIRPLDGTQKPHPLHKLHKVKPQSQSRKTARDKNKSFFERLCSSKSLQLSFYLSWHFQMFDAVNDLNLEENVPAKNLSITAGREGGGGVPRQRG